MQTFYFLNWKTKWNDMYLSTFELFYQRSMLLQRRFFSLHMLPFNQLNTVDFGSCSVLVTVWGLMALGAKQSSQAYTLTQLENKQILLQGSFFIFLWPPWTFSNMSFKKSECAAFLIQVVISVQQECAGVWITVAGPQHCHLVAALSLHTDKWILFLCSKTSFIWYRFS